MKTLLCSSPANGMVSPPECWELTTVKALIIEDNIVTQRLMEQVFQTRGYHVTTCADAEAGWEIFQEGGYHLVLVDWHLPGMTGVDLCRAIKESSSRDHCIVIMMTGHDTPEDIQTAIRAGAHDFIVKPVDMRVLRVRLAIAEQRLQVLGFRAQDNDETVPQDRPATAMPERPHRVEPRKAFCGLVGTSALMTRMYDHIRALAKVGTTVLIEGETGTGKELVARAIHFSSPRRGQPCIPVNCAGLSQSLLASQLFGHKRGAFTGATESQPGLFEAANGGTIFLDEIGDISMEVQTGLLRVLQEREVTRLGESKPRKVDVRILTATHHNLCHDVMQGSFRADLLYRIRVARIQLPPLRDRREDIPYLVHSMLGECFASMGKPILDVSDEVMDRLMYYEWPGNVRELKGVLECAVISCRDSIINLEDLPSELLTDHHLCGTACSSGPEMKSRLHDAMERAKGNRTTAARLLGMSRSTLYRRLREIGRDA